MLHNTYDKSNVFFFINNETNEKFLVGNKDELVKYICKFVWTRGEKNPRYWKNPIFEDFNLSGRDTKMEQVQDGYYVSDSGYSFPTYTTKRTLRKFEVVDGYDRHVDIRIFENDINEYVKAHNSYYSYYWAKNNVGKKPKDKKKRGPRTISHSSRTCKPKTLVTQAVRENDRIEDINKEFDINIKKNSVNIWDMGWKSVTTQANWKSSYKVPFQHNIHNAGKDNKSIRRDFYDDEIFDMDELLAEDF